MAELELHDLGRIAKTQPVLSTKTSDKPKKKIKIKVKSTSKKAKVVSKGIKKKKKSKDTLKEKVIAGKKRQRVSNTANFPAELKSGSQLEVLDDQMGELIDSIPDIVKQENDQIQEYLTMFETCRELARTAEGIYFDKKQSRDLYPIMQTYNQMREIIADLRALRDVGQMGEILNEEVISPLVQSNAAALINARQAMITYFKSNLQTSEIAAANVALDRIITEAAKSIQQSYDDALSKTIQVFNGDV